MLKHEDNPQTQTPPAAQVRVTPEELAAAVTALQIRKEGQPGTITIGDAVEELGLAVTPEEVLTEVEARRRTAKPKRKRDYLALACVGACIALFAVTESIAASHHHNAPPRAAASAVDIVQADTLDEVRNEQQAFVDTRGLRQLIDGEQPYQVQVFSSSQGIRWGVIKHSGKVYVQAYTFKTTEKGLRNNSVKLFSSEYPSDAPFESGHVFEDHGWSEDVKVTLPAQALRYQDSQQVDGISKVLVKEVEPDNHVWDGF